MTVSRQRREPPGKRTAVGKAHAWQFRARFRRHGFGWRSQPAIQRVKQAVSEIKKVARADRLTAAEGAVLFLEKVSPALEHVDSSSGAIGSAVNRAIAELSAVIAAAPAEAGTRALWLERLWDAYQEDAIPYIETLGEHWGELCATAEQASEWADRLIETCKMAWSPDPNVRGYFKGHTACLSALAAAQRGHEVIDLLARCPYRMWTYHQFGVRALVAMGRIDEAIRYAEDRFDPHHATAMARTCEDILLSAGRVDEAYSRYALIASRAVTNLAWFRAVAARYPHRRPPDILDDLVRLTAGEEGKWFAAAKDAGLLDEAIALARRSPCAPQTLTRAARDFADENPDFALEAGMAALHWLVEGYGYEVTGLDVSSAYTQTMRAAVRLGRTSETRERVRALVAREAGPQRFVNQILGAALSAADTPEEC
jgi:hypothetical protein